jgi:adenylosuccinate lyase
MSLLCPIDFRYGRPEMKAIFGEGARLQRLLDVEAALARAQAKVGTIPARAAQAISATANTNDVTANRVTELEKQTRHDIMAVVLALSEACGEEASRYVHLGATSNDISDTGTALQLRDAIRVLAVDLKNLRRVLVALAKKHRKTVILGRTHGQAAVPMTFGLKMAVFATETDRHLERLREVEKRVVVGKVNGAVGTGAALGDKALEIQKIVMEDLGIQAEEASTQIVGRDRYAEFVMVLANIAGSLDKFCTEVRNLQRTEIGEVAEAFEERQVGSSTMAQKENPVISENVCSLARVVRGFVIPALENVPLWHERDLTNSAAERIILPHACVLVDDMLAKTANVFRTLRVYPDRMRANLEATKGQAMAESVMIVLVGKGLGRQEAHRLVQRAAGEAREKSVHLRAVLASDAKVAKLLNAKDLDAALDPDRYLGKSTEIVDHIVTRLGA